MNKATFSMPLNLLMRDQSRLLVRRLGNTARAEHMVVMLWFEFGSQQKTLRPLRRSYATDGGSLTELSKDETLELIEVAVGWEGTQGDLIKAAIDVGFLNVIEGADKIVSVELAGFAEINPEFVPGYKTMQQRGAHASAERKRRKHDPASARQMTQILGAQKLLSFDTTLEETTRAIELIMQLDRLANARPRNPSEYSGRLMEAAVKVLRDFTPERIESLTAWLLHKREDATVLQGAEAVILAWHKYIERSQL